MNYNGWSIGFWVFNAFMIFTQFSMNGLLSAISVGCLFAAIYIVGRCSRERDNEMEQEDIYNGSDYPSA
jgi:hypothetical protein